MTAWDEIACVFKGEFVRWFLAGGYTGLYFYLALDYPKVITGFNSIAIRSRLSAAVTGESNDGVSDGM